MPDGSKLIVAGRTRHQIALADTTCKAVKTTLIDYDPTIHTDEWVHMTNAGEHIINRTATTEHYRTYFTHNPITHAQAIEQGPVPIDPRTGRPTAAYTKGRQLAEQDLQAKTEAAAAAAKAAAAEAKTKAEKQLPGQTKWSTPSPKSKPLSDSETKQTLISVAGKTVSTDGLRPVLSLVTIQRKKGTEYTVATDGRRLTVLSRSTTAPDTESDIAEVYNSKGEQAKTYHQHYPNWRQTIPLASNHQASTTIDLSYYSFLAKGSVKGGYTKRIDSPFFRDGQHIFFNIGNHRSAISPVFMRDIYKQMQQLGKKLGFPPTLKAYYFEEKAPLLFTAEHNGITYQSVVMPQRVHALDENGNKIREGGNYVYKTPDLSPGDIILGQQPSIYGEQDTGSFSLRRKRDLTLNKVHVTQKQAWEHLAELEGKPLRNARSQFVAVVNKPQRKELTNISKARKSESNGFSKSAHYTAVSRIESLFEHAVFIGEYPDLKHNDQNVHIYRFACPLMIDGEKAIAWLTAKQTINVDGSERLYNLELVDIEKLAGNLENIESENLSTLSPAASRDIVAEVEEAFKTYFEEAPESPSQQETSVSSLSLRRRVDRNINSLLNERETTLARVSDYIKREADRTANIMGSDTELQRAGVHFAQANAIINALDTYIFSKELIRKNTAEYRRLRDLRHFINEYITVARKGKLPVKRNTNLRSHLTEPASRHHLLPGGVGEITNMKRRIWQRCR